MKGHMHMYEDNERYCSVCNTELEEDEVGGFLNDGSLICQRCLKKNYMICENCEYCFSDDEMRSWDNDEWYCRDCFEKKFQLINTHEENVKAQEARQMMELRLKGRKTNEEKCGDIYIEDFPDEWCYQSIDVSIDENRRIIHIGQFKQTRSYWNGHYDEDKIDIPDRAEDYAEGGKAEKLLLNNISFIDEEENSGAAQLMDQNEELSVPDLSGSKTIEKPAEESNIEAVVNKKIIEEFKKQINEKKAEFDKINQQKEKTRKEIQLLEEMLERM